MSPAAPTATPTARAAQHPPKRIWTQNTPHDTGHRAPGPGPGEREREAVHARSAARGRGISAAAARGPCPVASMPLPLNVSVHCPVALPRRTQSLSLPTRPPPVPFASTSSPGIYRPLRDKSPCPQAHVAPTTVRRGTRPAPPPPARCLPLLNPAPPAYAPPLSSPLYSYPRSSSLSNGHISLSPIKPQSAHTRKKKKKKLPRIGSPID